MNVLCVVDRAYQRSVVVVDHSRNFKGIKSMVNPQIMGCNIEKGGILIQKEERGNYCSKLKKGMLKTKKLSKINILNEQEPSVQSAD